MPPVVTDTGFTMKKPLPFVTVTKSVEPSWAQARVADEEMNFRRRLLERKSPVNTCPAALTSHAVPEMRRWSALQIQRHRGAPTLSDSSIVLLVLFNR